MVHQPDVKRNGHHGVEDDDVPPEAEEASVVGRLFFTIVKIPGLEAGVLVPELVSDGQTSRHQDEQRKDLRNQTRNDWTRGF